MIGSVIVFFVLLVPSTAFAQSVRVAVSTPHPPSGCYTTISRHDLPQQPHIHTIEFISESTLVISAGCDLFTYAIETSTLECVLRLDRGSEGAAYHLEYSPSMNRLLIGATGVVLAVNVNDWSRSWSRRLSRFPFESFDLALNGSQLLLCTQEQETIVLDCHSNEEVVRLPSDSIRTVGAISESGNIIAVGMGNRVVVRDVDESLDIIYNVTHMGFIYELEVVEAGNEVYVISVHYPGVVHVAELTQSDFSCSFAYDYGTVKCLEEARTQGTLLVGYDSGRRRESGVRILNYLQGEVYSCTTTTQPSMVTGMDHSACGNMIAAASRNGVQIWKASGSHSGEHVE